MSFKLLDNQLLVLVDEGETNIGRIVQNNFRTQREFKVPADWYDPENPPDPLPEPTENTHVVFVREMADEVEIDGITYMGMHKNAVIGLIPD